MTNIKSAQEIQIMQEGGKKLRYIRKQLLAKIKVGVTPIAIDTLAQELIKKAGGTPSFFTVSNYKWATCISVNDGVVHGVPTNEPFSIGDVVGLDIGLLYQGYHTDTSWTIQVKSQSFDSTQDKKSRLYLPEQSSGGQAKVKNNIDEFLHTGEKALEKAIDQARLGNRIGHISQAIQSTVEGAGYSVVKSLVGHGVGKMLHEPPQVPGILTKPVEKTPLLQKGMVLAIEVIYTMGKGEIVYKNTDNWTLETADGSLSGLFEQTVVLCEKEAVVLT